MIIHDDKHTLFQFDCDYIYILISLRMTSVSSVILYSMIDNVLYIEREILTWKNWQKTWRSLYTFQDSFKKNPMASEFFV